MKLIVAVLLLILPNQALAAPGYAFEKIVRAGDPAPGTGETFGQIGVQTIDEATGRVAALYLARPQTAAVPVTTWPGAALLVTLLVVVSLALRPALPRGT
jgi:hypothetical protein